MAPTKDKSDTQSSTETLLNVIWRNIPATRRIAETNGLGHRGAALLRKAS